MILLLCFVHETLFLSLSLDVMYLIIGTDAVRRNANSCRATDASLEKDTQRWLRQAGDRDGGRQERYKRKLLEKATVPEKRATPTLPLQT